MQGACVSHGFGGAAHLGFGNDFEQRRAGPVEVDARHAGKVLVQRFAGIFFEVGTGEIDGAHLRRLTLSGGRDGDVQRAALDHRLLVLADLVALGQVRIEIVLAGKDGDRCHAGADGQPEADGMFHRPAVEHRQHTRQRQIDRAGLGVGLGAKPGGGPGEDLRLGQQLDMGFQSDHHFPLHERISVSAGIQHTGRQEGTTTATAGSGRHGMTCITPVRTGLACAVPSGSLSGPDGRSRRSAG